MSKRNRFWSTALVLTACVIAAPSALGSPVGAGNESSQAGQASAEQPYVDALAREGVATTPSSGPAPSSPAPAAVTSDGFDWGDAGIGAVTMIALAAIAGGVLLVGSQPRRRQGTA